MTLNVEEEVKQLVEEIKRLGAKGPDGKTSVRHHKLERTTFLSLPRLSTIDLKNSYTTKMQQLSTANFALPERPYDNSGVPTTHAHTRVPCRLTDQPRTNDCAQVKFGVLFADDRCANIFEALVGTLRAAKKRKVKK